MSQCSTAKQIRKLKPQWQSTLRLSLLPLPSVYIVLSVLLSALVTMPTANAASCKLPKTYYKNVSCTSSGSYFLAIKDFGAPVALLNSSGKKIMDLEQYQRVAADKISGGLMPVLRNSHVGYINMQGREVIRADYDMLKESGGNGWARPVSEGRIVVKKDGKYGVISTANKTIVPFSASISDIDNYRSGVARVSKNKAISWLDKNGKSTANPNASSTNDSSDSSRNDSAQASNNNLSNNSPSNSNPFKDNASTSGNSRPAVGFTTLQPHQQDGKWGFVDDQNVTMITYSFDEVRSFSEGLAGVRVDDKWGFLSLGGELMIPFRFDKEGVTASDSYNGKPAFVFTGGKAWVGSLKNGRKICIDKEGTNVSCD